MMRRTKKAWAIAVGHGKLSGCLSIQWFNLSKTAAHQVWPMRIAVFTTRADARAAWKTLTLVNHPLSPHLADPRVVRVEITVDVVR